MNTTRNRSKVMAIALRAATTDMRRIADEACYCTRCQEARDNALESIDVVAEELEQLAAAPDPDGGRS